MSTNTRPVGPRTGYAHPECYAAPLADCSDIIASEQPLSETIQETYRTGGHARRRLCTRHSDVVAPLCRSAETLFDALWAYRDGREVGWQTIDGEDVDAARKSRCSSQLVAVGSVVPVEHEHTARGVDCGSRQRRGDRELGELDPRVDFVNLDSRSTCRDRFVEYRCWTNYGRGSRRERSVHRTAVTQQ